MLCGNVWPELGPGRQMCHLELWDRPAGSGEGGLHQAVQGWGGGQTFLHHRCSLDRSVEMTRRMPKKTNEVTINK